MTTPEQRTALPQLTESSPIKNGRLYFKDLEPIHRIAIPAINSHTDKPSIFTIIPISIRTSSDGTKTNVTFLYQGTGTKELFGFHKLGNQNEVYTIPKGSLIESHVSGHLVTPHDCRELNSEFIEGDRGWDIAFDVLRNKQILAIAAHNIGPLSISRLSHPYKSPKTHGYFESLHKARGV